MAQTLEQLKAAAVLANAQVAAAEKAAAAAAAAAATPRDPEVVLADIFTNIAGRLGNRPDLRALIAEFKAATKPATS